MTEFSYPFNAVETAPNVFDRTYDAADLARAFLAFNNGVTSGLGLSIGAGLTTVLAAGGAFINGYSYYNDANKTMTHATADATNNRYDLIVARLDLGNRTITATIIQGTPAASPAVPALSNTATIIDIPLHRVLVRANATTFATTDLTPFMRSTERFAYFAAMDLNVVTQTGQYSGTNITNGPSGVTTGFLWVNQYGQWNATSNILSVAQLLMDYNTGKMYSRYRSSGGTWSAWRKIQQEPDTGKPYLYAYRSAFALVTAGQTITGMTAGTNIGPYTVAGSAFTVPTAGLYQIDCYVQISGVTVNNKRVRFGFQHLDNAGAVIGTYYIGGLSPLANDYHSGEGTRVWAFGAGERIQPYLDNGTGAAATCDTFILTVTRAEDRS